MLGGEPGGVRIVPLFCWFPAFPHRVLDNPDLNDPDAPLTSHNPKTSVMTTVETPRNMDPREERAEEGYMTGFQIFMKGVDIFSLDLEGRT